MTLGLYLLSLMSPSSSTFLDALCMLVLGMGLGGVMQVLVIIVQNGVAHSELGVATSGATFFRSIGGSFGTAIFGAIFSNVLVGNLASHLHGLSLPAGFSAADVTPAVLDHLPAAVHLGFVNGYAETIQTVFLVAVADRRARVPRHLADPAGGAQAVGGAWPPPPRRQRRPGRRPWTPRPAWTTSRPRTTRAARRCSQKHSIRRTPAGRTAAGDQTRADA